jgi:hypothetical protein
VQGLDLARVADELYGLSPDDFRAARDERAGEARAAGDKDLARAIAALRRPVVSAWLVNRLAREAAGQMGELVALGESLRDAQQALDGDRLRELSTQRRQLIAAMVSEAKRLAARDGRPVSLQVEREVEATLQAALADPGAAAAVRAGQLASPLSYAGLGAGEVATVRTGGRAGKGAPSGAAEAAAERTVPRERAARAEGAAGQAPDGGRPKARGLTEAERLERDAAQREAREAAAAERREREAAAARQAVEDAATAEAAARAALDEADRAAAGARAAQEEVRQRAERLDRELAEALAEQSRATRTVRDAQRGRDAAVRALDTATKRLARARQAASRLGQDT